MPKQKTHKGLKKRVKVTATGKVVRHCAGTGHLMSGKSAKHRRRLTNPALVDNVFLKRTRELLGE